MEEAEAAAVIDLSRIIGRTTKIISSITFFFKASTNILHILIKYYGAYFVFSTRLLLTRPDSEVNPEKYYSNFKKLPTVHCHLTQPVLEELLNV